MVARNFSLQDLPSSYRLLSVPDDDEREFLTLGELKPHHLTDLGADHLSNTLPLNPQQVTDEFNENLNLNHSLIEQEYVYYDLNTQQPKYLNGLVCLMPIKDEKQKYFQWTVLVRGRKSN